MKTGLIIRAFVASPGDVADERDMVSKVIADWNGANSFNRNAIIEPVRIETHAQAALGEHPQELINKQLLDRCDFLIAIFWKRLGTATPTQRSGTIHEIAEYSDRKGADRVMLFFSGRPVPHDTDHKEWGEFKQFQKDIQSKGLYIQYSDANDFGVRFRNQLEMKMNDLLIDSAAASISATTISVPRVSGPLIPPPAALVSLDDDEIKILLLISQSSNLDQYISLIHVVSDASNEGIHGAEISCAIDALRKNGLVEITQESEVSASSITRVTSDGYSWLSYNKENRKRVASTMRPSSA